MKTTSIIQDLYSHGDWANRKLLAKSEGLSDEQLDEPKEMGFGTLRNTFFHILEAEKLWLERWQGKPWRPLVADAGGMPLKELSDELNRIAAIRNDLILEESKTNFSRIVAFKDSRGTEGKFEIGDLLNHVSNHGVHHRAQVLSYLRGFERTIPGGVDYLFGKLSSPSCEIPEESLQPIREYGLEVCESEGNVPEFDRERIIKYLQYSDWAMFEVYRATEVLSEENLDREFSIGMGTLRKTYQHIIDAERWWLANWDKDKSPFPHGEDPRSKDQLQAQYEQVSKQVEEFASGLDAASATRVVKVSAGGPTSCFRVTESLLQLCCHGTHHRAQCLNMLRQLNVAPPAIDLPVWLRNNS